MGKSKSFYKEITPVETNDSINYKSGNSFKPGNKAQFYNENKPTIDAHVESGLSMEEALKKALEEKSAVKIGLSKNPVMKIKDGNASFYNKL